MKRGVPRQGPQARRLLRRPPADHLGRDVDQALDRHGGADADPGVVLGDLSRARAMAEMSMKWLGFSFW